MPIKNKHIVYYLMFFILLISSNLSCSNQSSLPKLIGTWEVYNDDDTPNKPPPYETMNFWNNGRFCIERDFPYKGTYEINQSSLNLTVELKNKTIVVNREYKLSKNELKFKNKKIGWVYYKKISEKPMEECFGK